MLEPRADAQSFCASTNFIVAVGALCAFMLAIALEAALSHGHWTFSLCLFAAAAIALAALWALRLEILPSGVKRRFLIGSQFVEFDALIGARLEVLGKRGGGCFTLCLERRHGRRVRIALRQFRIEASVALLSVLESRGIEIEVADDRARYFARQVALARAASAK